MTAGGLLKLLFLGLCLIGSKIACPQPVYPVFHTHNAAPLKWIYSFHEAGLIAVGNDTELQLWDSHSQAYYGSVTVHSPLSEFDGYIRIRHVEYLKESGRIAIVAEGPVFDSNRHTWAYTDYLFLYSLITLNLYALPVPNGMAELIKFKFKYEHKHPMPIVRNAADIFQYYYHESSGTLYTIDRVGVINVYKGNTWIKALPTSAVNSQILYVTDNDSRVFYTDDARGVFEERSLQDGAVKRRIGMKLVPRCPNIDNLDEQDRNFCVTVLPDKHEFLILDSINRFRRCYDLLPLITTLDVPVDDRATFVNWDEADDNLLFIAENEVLCQPVAGTHSTKTMLNNTYDNGNISSGLIGYTFNKSNEAKIRIIVPGYGKKEIDLTKLTGNTPEPDTANANEKAGFGTWEKGYVKIRRMSVNKMHIDVFRSDSIQDSLYSQIIALKEDEDFAGIRPSVKWWIATSKLSKRGKPGAQVVRIYDSTGKQLFTQTGFLALQMMNLSSHQQIFSSDERHLLIKEIVERRGTEDSCRLRIFNTNGFSLEADIRFAEESTDPRMNQTAFFSKDGSLFYHTALRRQDSIKTTFFVRYRLERNRFIKTGETRLCVNEACQLPVSVGSIAFSPDDSTIIYGGMVKTNPAWLLPNYVQVLRCINAADGETKWKMNMLPDKVLRRVLNFKHFIGLQFDDFIDFYNFDNGGYKFLTLTPICNLHNGNLSVLYTSEDKLGPTFYYDLSGNESLVGFRVGTLPLGRYYGELAYNRPDKIIDRIPEGDTNYRNMYHRAWLKRAERLFNAQQGFNMQNTAELSLVTTSYERGNFKIRFTINQGYPLKYLHILINGNSERRDITAESRRANMHNTFNYELTTPLSFGENRIRLTVIDTMGRESLPLALVQNEYGDVKKPNLHLLVLSVGKYKDARANVSWVVPDGRAMADIFGHHLTDGLFRTTEIDTLFNEQVTEANVYAWIEKHAAVSPNDYVILFFSGHGHLDSLSQLKLMTSEVSFKEPYAKTIDYSSLLDKLESLPARQKLFIIDACYSGDLDKKILQGDKLNQDDFDFMQDMFTFSQIGSGTFVYTSCKGIASALGPGTTNPEDYYSPFLSAMREALVDNKASADRYGRIRINDFFRFVTTRTWDLSRHTQKPDLKLDNTEANWRIK